MKKALIVVLITICIVCFCGCEVADILGITIPTVKRTPNPTNMYGIVDFGPVSVVSGKDAEEFLRALKQEDIDTVTAEIFNSKVLVPQNIEGEIIGFSLKEYGRYIYDDVEAIGFDANMDSFQYEVAIKLNEDKGVARIRYTYKKTQSEQTFDESYEPIASIEGERAYIYRDLNQISVLRVYGHYTITITVPADYGDATGIRLMWKEYKV